MDQTTLIVMEEISVKGTIKKLFLPNSLLSPRSSTNVILENCDGCPHDLIEVLRLYCWYLNIDLYIHKDTLTL